MLESDIVNKRREDLVKRFSVHSLLIHELEAKDSGKMNKEELMDKYIKEDMSYALLEKIDTETKLLFPSYLIRLANFSNLDKADEQSLKIMMENGSYNAYLEYKSRENNNLSKMTDEFLILAIQNGDAYSELEILVSRYKKFIEKIINSTEKKYYFKGQDKEDLIQEANIGLMKAIEVFKVERKTKFKDFSRHVIERHLGTLMYRSNNLRNRTLNESISYNSPITAVNSSQPTTLEEMIEGEEIKPDDIFEKKELFSLIESQLTENEKEVLYPYSEGYTYEEIAFLLISKKNVMNFKDLSYNEVAAFLKIIACEDDFDSRESFERALKRIPYSMIIDGEFFLCGYPHRMIAKELKRRKKSVDNTIQRMRTKGVKQKFSFDNDGKVWFDEEDRGII